MFYRYSDAVHTFHRTFLLPSPDNPTLCPTGPDNSSICDLRVRLLQEEVDELSDAYAAGDLVEIADAIADILYLVYGTADTFGIRLFDVASETKTNPTVTGGLDIEDLSMRLATLKSNIRSLDLVGVTLDLAALAVEAHRIARMFQIDIDPVFFEVHRSNMSKLDENGQPIFREDGKVLKSHLYSRPDIRPILEDQATKRRVFSIDLGDVPPFLPPYTLQDFLPGIAAEIGVADR